MTTLTETQKLTTAITMLETAIANRTPGAWTRTTDEYGRDRLIAAEQVGEPIIDPRFPNDVDAIILGQRLLESVLARLQHVADGGLDDERLTNMRQFAPAYGHTMAIVDAILGDNA
ncbi:hypothetical protein [Agromyces humi]|uniref:hypothetical protein n=1 Tax=Agromyces humi TaxID=1766800 RepID=UPI001357B437|nr:hypothetical protein [Agromyces humi]